MPVKTLLCGCVYEENEWILVRIKECEKPKAECNRNDTRGE